jgi:signal transduction histidine kinase
MPRHRVSVSTKLLLLIFLVGLLPSGVAIVELYHVAVSTTREALGLQLLERAQGMMVAVDGRLQSIAPEVDRSVQRLAGGLSPQTALSPLAGLVDGAALVDVHGHASWGSQPRLLDGVLEVPSVLSTRMAQGSLFIDEVSSGPLAPALRVFSTVGDGRYVVAWVRLEKLVEPFGISLPGDQTQLVLVTNRRNIAARSPAPESIVVRTFEASTQNPGNLAGWLSVRDKGGTDYLAAFRASSFLRQRQKAGQTVVDWLAIAYTDTQFVLPALNAILWRMGILGIALVCLLTALSLGVSATFLRPLRRLHYHVEQIARGNWEQRADIRTGDEIEELALAFNNMLSEIRNSHAALERQIDETRARASQVELVIEISKALLASFSLQKLVAAAYTQLSKLVPCRRALLAVVRETGWEVHAEPAMLPASVPQSASLDVIWQRLVEANEFLLIETLGAEAADRRDVCVLRLAPAGERLGLFLIELEAGEGLGEAQRNLLLQLAPFLALAVRHLQLFEQVFNLAAELEHKVEERAEQLREAHQRLLESERLAVTGQLAAGVAHEINNPLAIIRNMLQLLRFKGELDADTLKAIEEEIDRIARIVRGLLDFARPPSSGGPPAEVLRDAQHVAALFAATLNRRHITLELDVPADLPPLAISSDHLRQVLVNLIRNAEQAVPDGGTISVRANRAATADGQPVAVVEVRDNGAGIPPEVLPRIFEPFFTTRHSRDGVGLGLAVTHRLVASAGGKIEVGSEPGHGTCFSLILPLAQSTKSPGTC